MVTATEKSPYMNPATQSPSIRDLEWAAGFLEGEGSFAFSKHKNISVVAAQVQKEPLERLQAMFGGGIYGNRPKNPNSHYCWRWQTVGSRAVGICMTLYSLMSTRRKDQIRVALDGWKKKRPKNGLEARCMRGHLFEGDNLYVYDGKRYCKTCRSYSEQVQRGWRKPDWKNRRPGEKQNFQCIYGHPLEGENLYIWKDKRYCRTCRDRWNGVIAERRKLERQQGKNV